jgi:7-cyano-7-deazaguanine synthase
MKPEAVVLLSSGLDSAVNLALALESGLRCQALHIHYGQRAAVKEHHRSRALAKYFDVSYEVVELPFLGRWSQSSLNKTDKMIPTGSAVDINDSERSRETAKSVWVPNRNGLFLNIAAAYAESLQANLVIPGFNAEEGATFPDNSVEFIRATSAAFAYSTANQVQVKCLTDTWNKEQIVNRAQQLKFPFQLLWPCYFSEETWCGQCESCLRFQRALEKNSLSFFNLQKQAGQVQ